VLTILARYASVVIPSAIAATAAKLKTLDISLPKAYVQLPSQLSFESKIL
jgi:hypothetical protein